MPIFDFIEGRYNNITFRYETFNKGLTPKAQFWKELKIKKPRSSFKCACCEKNKPKGTRCIGDSYERICFSCFEEWIENSNKTFSNIQERFKEIKEELNNNKEKWNRELIVNSLST